LDRSPPPFFRQGLSALSKLVLCAALSVFLMAADQRFSITQPLRNAIATALLPAVRLLSVPVDLARHGADSLGGLGEALSRAEKLERQLADQAVRVSQAAELAKENLQLRGLLALRPALQVRSLSAEVLYEAPDAFSQKMFIDRGGQHGVLEGSPVVNEAGVLGQVTRSYLLTAEVTLLADKDAAIPVLNTRTQHRSAAFGSGEDGLMELRFVAANDDVQAGDLLLTSGVDGIYPPGLPVARVTKVDRRGDAGFARINLQPVALPGGVRHVLVLEPLKLQQPPRPEAPLGAPAPATPLRRGAPSSAPAPLGANPLSASAAAKAASGSFSRPASPPGAKP
jgi:rod shape-determining protein MreC